MGSTPFIFADIERHSFDAQDRNLVSFMEFFLGMRLPGLIAYPDECVTSIGEEFGNGTRFADDGIDVRFICLRRYPAVDIPPPEENVGKADNAANDDGKDPGMEGECNETAEHEGRADKDEVKPGTDAEE